jgi:DNA-binding winged helix-turn-helix (wHTH) protein
VGNEVAFGPFVLSLAQRRLWHSGSRVALKPKEVELLALLAERQPRTITKDEIIERLWRGGSASDAALTQTVYRLRQTLGRYASKSDFIRTVPGIGLQFAGGSPIEVRSDDLDALRPAFSLYQRAVSHYRRRTEASTLVAIRLLESVSAEDPQYVPALLMLAKAYTAAGTRGILPPQHAYWQARRSLELAIGRDPMSPDALSTLSTLLLFFNSDRERAHEMAEHALLIAPHSLTAHKAAVWERISCGDFAGALTHADLAVRSGPASQQSTSLLGIVLYLSQRYNEAHGCFETARALGPRSTTALFYDACTQIMLGDFDNAQEQLETISGTDLRTRAIALRGVIAAKCGDASAFGAALTALSDLPEPTDIALSTLLTAHGDLNAAVKALLRAQRTREPGLFLVAVDPLYMRLREQHADLALALQHARPGQCDRCGMPLQPSNVREVPECSLCGPCYLLLSTRN